MLSSLSNICIFVFALLLQRVIVTASLIRPSHPQTKQMNYESYKT